MVNRNVAPTNPLISVIIPCYNHARFLPDAIESALHQSVKNKEIIVVDDGSTDNTAEVTRAYPGVKYIHQPNQGLSAARNTGIDHSEGDYLVFLDADDWLYPNALTINCDALQRHPQWAFVSGWHDKVDEWKYPVEQDEQIVVTTNHYLQLLKGNYIGMHATVMYQRWVFEEFRFDTSLKACEDYDLYLKVTRKYAVGNHSSKIAAYRIHGNNMSMKIPFMLKHVLEVLHRHDTVVATEDERKALANGVAIWKEYYSAQLYKTLSHSVRKTDKWPSITEMKLLAAEKPVLFMKYVVKKARHQGREWSKRKLPDSVLRSLHRLKLFRLYTPKTGHVHAGDFERVTPFSYDFGFDRGGPIDRCYIEHFLVHNQNIIKGRVLEIGDNEYTLRYGGDAVVKSDILHINSANAKATFVGDLSNAPHVPSDAFDCIILTQTLHFIYDFKEALRTCYRVLKPGGTLLLTVPGISHIDHGEWRDYWLWAFTDKSMKRLVAETFPGADNEIKTYGNVFVAAAFLYGMGLPEFPKKYLWHHDPSYQVIISVKVTKPA
jgi:glycosyltransferase involved in cell wall biosynthesis